MISPETIALVKERTDLVALIGETVKLTRRGRSFVGLCPFHKEKSPSFHVSPERGYFHCFGCKESGTAVDFLMKTEGQTFPEAIKSLAERAGVEIQEALTDAERREAHAAKRAKDDLYAVNALAATYFERCLRDPRHGGHALSHYARAELAKRGLPWAEPPTHDGQEIDRVAATLQAFRIGYAPFGWDGLANFLRQQGVSPIAAEKVGLLVPRSSGSGHYDRFRHRLMFAVSDVMGRVLAFSGRALPDPDPAELARHNLTGPSTANADGPPAKYVNSPESPIYTKGEHLFGLYQARQAIRQRGEAVLVEGNFDVVSLHAHGIGHVVAPLGTAFTPAQAKLLKRFAPTVVVLFDGDAAGRKATRASRGPCREGGLTARVASLPTGADPDELVRTGGPEALQRVLKSARGMLEHLIDDALSSSAFGGATLTEQLARIRSVATLLRDEDDPTLRMMAKSYADQLSAQLVIGGRSPTDLRQLEQIMEQATYRPDDAAERRDTSVTRGETARSSSSADRLALDALGPLVDFPELLDDDEVASALAVLDGEAALAVAALRQAWSPEKGLSGADFLALLPPPIHAFAAGRLASPAFESLGDAKVALLRNAGKLERLSLKRENAAVVDRLHRVGSQGDAAAEDELLREVQRRSRRKLGLS
jgi:DNA primase